MSEEIMTWKMFDDACNKIIRRLTKTKRHFSNVYGIPKGGLRLAKILADYMEIELTDKVDDNTLIVDDISDTGKTLYPFKDHFIVTLYYKKGSRVVPNIWIYEKKDKWIIFPWE